MALSSSDIAVSSSQYRGDAGLGGSGFGSFQIDTRPIEQLAYYTYLYNRSEYDQRQKDAEAAAKEIADYTSYDLTSAIEKDAKILEAGYDKLLKYVQANPDALNYRNKKAWAEYKRQRNELENDLLGAKTRSTLKVIRDKEIADEKNEERKKLLKENLDKEISETGIRTPLQHTQKYDISVPEIPKANAVTFDVYRKGANQDFRRDYSLLDMRSLNAMSSAFELDLAADMVDATTDAGKQKLIARGENFWLKGSEIFNAALQSAKNPEGIIDETKLKGLSKEMVDLIKKTNKYLEVKRNEISSGAYTDKFGNSITFGTAGLREEDYQPINYQDGNLSPAELAKVAGIASWIGDTFKTAAIQHNDMLEQQRIGTEWARIGIARSQLNKSSTEDLIGADAVIREVQDAIRMGRPISKNGKMVITQGGVGQTAASAGTALWSTELVEIADPDLLKEFGNIDKDGTTTNVPDAIHFNKTKNQLSLVYYDTDVSGSKTVMDEKLLNPTQWIGKIVRRKNPNKDIGGINSLIDQVYNKFDRNLINLTNNYGGGATAVTSRTESSQQSTTAKQINRSEIATKAAAAGYSAKEYEKLLKNKGIKIID